MRPLVLDTNIVLDVFVFRDAAAGGLGAAIASGSVRWIATQAMRDELAAVLGFAQIVARMRAADTSPGKVMGTFDAHAELIPAPSACGLVCRDPDDQKFIDLAVSHRAVLLTKDRAVLALARRLARVGAHATRVLPCPYAAPGI